MNSVLQSDTQKKREDLRKVLGPIATRPVRIPADAYELARTAAFHSRRTIAQVIADTLKKGLGKRYGVRVQ